MVTNWRAYDAQADPPRSLAHDVAEDGTVASDPPNLLENMVRTVFANENAPRVLTVNDSELVENLGSQFAVVVIEAHPDRLPDRGATRFLGLELNPPKAFL